MSDLFHPAANAILTNWPGPDTLIDWAIRTFPGPDVVIGFLVLFAEVCMAGIILYVMGRTLYRVIRRRKSKA